MSAAGFLARWTSRKAEASAPKPAQPSGQAPDAAGPAEPEPELDLDMLRSLWAQNPTIGLPDGLDIDCGNFDDASAEKAFADLWDAGRKVARQLAESSAKLEAEAIAGEHQPLV